MISWERYNPLSKYYFVKCKKNDMKKVYKDPVRALPFPLVDHAIRISVSLLGDIPNISVDYKKGLTSLLAVLSKEHQSLIGQFCTVYLTYTHDPCKFDSFLAKETKKILKHHREQLYLTKRIEAILAFAPTTESADSNKASMDPWRELLCRNPKGRVTTALRDSWTAAQELQASRKRK